MYLQLENNLGSKDIERIMNQVKEKADSNAALEIGIENSLNARVIDESVFEEMKGLLYEAVGDEDWKSRWD